MATVSATASNGEQAQNSQCTQQTHDEAMLDDGEFFKLIHDEAVTSARYSKDAVTGEESHRGDGGHGGALPRQGPQGEPCSSERTTAGGGTAAVTQRAAGGSQLSLDACKLLA
jgi:hypothetical protein